MNLESSPGKSATRSVYLTILVAALGYFVDIYDLILFLIVRAKSLKGLGVAKEALLDTGVSLLNTQMIGMLVGGILWGILGDKRGRLSVLFGSIFLYSAANIANGFVESVTQYRAMRFIAGVGLAGELGAGITLVSEVMSREGRGYGTTIVASVGVLGAVVAALVGDTFSWRVAYFVGGGLGFFLLLLRVGLFESGMFEQAKRRDVVRGNFFSLFTKPDRLRRYLAVIFIGVPIWFVISILIGLSPEIAADMGMKPGPQAGQAVMLAYIGLSIGDLASGSLSQFMRSRKKVVGIFMVLSVLGIIAYFTVAATSLVAFYACCLALGVAGGYWAVFVTIASEQFGTNIRATATTTVPNFVRGAVVGLTTSFSALKGPLGVTHAAMTVGTVCFVVGAISLRSLDETYGKDLDFVE
ncbi:MAG TPA: MFS transporter [Polyangiaceae bacterium]|nr:MFS transporter [Polyangiaceae bacterium]